jgi:hypothetical protein
LITPAFTPFSVVQQRGCLAAPLLIRCAWRGDNIAVMHIRPADVDRLAAAHILSTSLSSSIQPAPDHLHAGAERVIHRQLILHLVHCMDHRRVVTPAEQVADLDQ